MTQRDNSSSTTIGLISLILAVVVFFFGDNIYQQMTGESFFARAPTPVSNPEESTEVVNIRGEVWSHTFNEPHIYHTHPISSQDLRNFSLSADFQIDGEPSEFHGLMFRQQDSGSFYSFRITKEGEYAFDLWNSRGESTFTRLLGPANSNAILTGEGAINFLKVIGREQKFDLYVNGTFIGSVSDNTFSNGTAGFVACTCDGGDSATVTVLNAVLKGE